MKYFAIPGIFRCEFFQGENKKYIPDIDNILEDEVIYSFEDKLFAIKVNPIHNFGLTVAEMQVYCPDFIGSENEKYIFLTKKCEYIGQNMNKIHKEKVFSIKEFADITCHVVCPFCDKFCNQKCFNLNNFIFNKHHRRVKI